MNTEWGFPNPATPSGSGSYYCVRCAPAEYRDDLALLYAWQHTLCNIPSQVSDRGVALAKLRWYRDELPRALSAQSQHPLLRALAQCIDRHTLPLAPLLTMADAVEADLAGFSPQDLDELVGYCQQSGGSLLELITRIGGGDDQALRCGRELGICVRLCAIIRDLGADLRRQCLHLPFDALQRLAIPPERLDAPEHTQSLRRLLTELAGEARRRHRAALAQQPSGPHPALGPALAHSAIALALLDDIERAGFPVLDQRLSLTPLRKLWLAWRASRRATRGLR